MTTNSTKIADLTATFDSDDNSVQLQDGQTYHGAGRVVDGELHGEFDLSAGDFDALAAWAVECADAAPAPAGEADDDE